MMIKQSLIQKLCDTPDQTHLYSTLLHELGHWTAAKSRLDRDLSGRFGNEAYAMEELVAVLSR